MKATRAISGAVAAMALLLMPACSVSVNAGGSMDKAKVEQKLSEVFEEKTGSRPDEIECPDDLKGEVDATMKCTMTKDGNDYDASLKVTKVDGSDINFDYNIVPRDDGGDAASSTTLAENILETEVADVLEKQVGQRPDDVDCPGDLPAKVGETMRCTLTAGADRLGLTVTVTEVVGTSVNFDVDVDES
ncbi:hypothetical protein J2S40_004189 [Nocardioides luteus]|uniref:DUF4333 domain-containing protein n=1 Tax=Nocardioides luteus TaxID=1844 RepID=A0ABQ5SRP2_9ACTN|nr:DUF4333 domain-containing protein [Nocardioides luteus]MDR7313131.1 hypothetical protein [Nocardioides luteus]GGR43896.1 hypothetical protein GCM10010197_06670 [Nocardioides luteus]GLJ66194.1 hypothetical protein GCM10017579_02300 [Nocardioides luteus]